MNKISTYYLNDTLELQALYLPKAAKILHIHNSSMGIALSVLSSATSSVTELRKFQICSNTNTIYHERLEYIGSFEDSSNAIKHLFEIF